MGARHLSTYWYARILLARYCHAYSSVPIYFPHNLTNSTSPIAFVAPYNMNTLQLGKDGSMASVVRRLTYADEDAFKSYDSSSTVRFHPRQPAECSGVRLADARFTTAEKYLHKGLVAVDIDWLGSTIVLHLHVRPGPPRTISSMLTLYQSNSVRVSKARKRGRQFSPRSRRL